MANKKGKRHKDNKSSVKGFLAFVLVIIIIASALSIYKKLTTEKPIETANLTNVEKVEEGEVSFHFLELGNSSAGDCTYIKAGDNDILIDAGSTVSSVKTIKSYLDKYVLDGSLEYVIITHADTDHIAGFSAEKGIFYYYDCNTIIDFPKTSKTTATYNNYIVNRNNEIEGGATHYTALDCINQQNGATKTFDLGNSISFEILDNYFYTHTASVENDYSVCVQFYHGERKFLFTGDLEETYNGESRFIKLNQDKLGNVVLFKAGHHGSYTANSVSLIYTIKPKIVCVNCCAGSVQYSQELKHTFPSQEFINIVAPYTKYVYVTTTIDIALNTETNKYKNSGNYKLLNGNIVVKSTTDGVSVECSYSNTPLYKTDWLKKNRAIPECWKEN